MRARGWCAGMRRCCPRPPTMARGGSQPPADNKKRHVHESPGTPGPDDRRGPTPRLRPAPSPSTPRVPWDERHSPGRHGARSCHAQLGVASPPPQQRAASQRPVPIIVTSSSSPGAAPGRGTRPLLLAACTHTHTLMPARRGTPPVFKGRALSSHKHTGRRTQRRFVAAAGCTIVPLHCRM